MLKPEEHSQSACIQHGSTKHEQYIWLIGYWLLRQELGKTVSLDNWTFA